MLLALLSLPLASSRAAAQCALEGVVRAEAWGEGAAAAELTQRSRVTLAGAGATLEGLAPLVYRREVPWSRVRLYLSGPASWRGVMTASPGVRAEVTGARGDDVTATLRSGEMTVRDVTLPCRALTPIDAPMAPVAGPALPPNPRWNSRSSTAYEARCTRWPGGLSCGTGAPRRSWCRPRGDGSHCGYHPVGASLRMHASPSADSAFVTLEVTRDVQLVDDDGGAGWIRVRSTGPGIRAIAVHGWVRARDVRWAQEVPPSLRGDPSVARSRAGRRVRVSDRRGRAVLPAGAEVYDAGGAVVARVADGGFCTSAELPLGAARAYIALPGAWEVSEGARVDASRLAWVDECPPAQP